MQPFGKISVRSTAYVSAFFYAVISGFSFMNTKISLTFASLTQILFLRFAAALVFVLLLAAFKIIKLRFRGKPKRYLFIASGAYVLLIFFQSFGLVYTTSVVCGILFAVVPVFSRIIGGIVLKEKSTWVQNAFAALSISSLVTMLAIGSFDSLRSIHPVGFILLLAAGILCAVSNVYMRFVRTHYSPVEISFVSIVIGFLAMLPIAAFTEGFENYLAPLQNSRFLFAILYIGIACTFFTGSLISYALRHLPAMTATIWGNLTTVTSVIAGAMILKEPLYTYQIVCTVLIITGVAGIIYFTKPQKEPPLGGFSVPVYDVQKEQG